MGHDDLLNALHVSSVSRIKSGGQLRTAMIPEVSKDLMGALARAVKRARAREGQSIHVGDVVLSLVVDYRLQGDIAIDPLELSSHLSGKDFDLDIADAEGILGGHQTAIKASRALNEVEWLSRRQSKIHRDRRFWTTEARSLLGLAFLNADSVNDPTVVWTHCMNIAFSFEILEPREQPSSGRPLFAAASPVRWYPWVPFADLAKYFAIAESDTPKLVSGLVSGVAWLGRGEVRKFGPLACLLQQEAIREAVRHGDDMVTSAHILMVIVSAASQLRLIEAAVAKRHQPALGAGYSLLDRGVDALSLGELMQVPPIPGFPEDAYKGRLWQRAPGDPVISASASALFESAAECASERARSSAHRRGRSSICDSSQ